MDIVFQEHPTVFIGSSEFRNVPTIIQWEDTPLMEVGKFESAGYTTKFAIFHSDGTRIAVIKGTQIYLTDEGKNAALKLRYEPNLTACELEGNTIFELRRQGAAAIKGAAELYAPEGVFVKATDRGVDVKSNLEAGRLLAPNGFLVTGCEIEDVPIGIHLTKNVLAIGGEGGPYPNGFSGLVLGSGDKVALLGSDLREKIDRGFNQELREKLGEKAVGANKSRETRTFVVTLSYSDETGKVSVTEVEQLPHKAK